MRTFSNFTFILARRLFLVNARVRFYLTNFLNGIEFSYKEKIYEEVNEMESKPYGTVLLKAATILDYLSQHRNAKLQEISQGTKMTPSTTLKILDTLVLIGYVEKTIHKEFKLGMKFLHFSHESLSQFELPEIAAPFLLELQNQIDETIHLGIIEKNEILYVDKLEPRHQNITMSSKIGITRPMYSSAMGKAVLAEFSRKDLEQYLNDVPLKAFTENTITNPIRLEKELDLVQKNEVAFDDEEMEKDIFCIGVAVVANHQIKGAFSVSIPKYRLSSQKRNEIISAVLDTKEKIEAKMS